MAGNSINRVIQRLEETVNEETSLLRSHASVDLNEYNARKSQGLLELTRALRTFDIRNADLDTVTQLQGLRGALEANSAVLNLHLQAVREIATLVSDTIRQSDSDGTYSPPGLAYGAGL